MGRFKTLISGQTLMYGEPGLFSAGSFDDLDKAIEATKEYVSNEMEYVGYAIVVDQENDDEIVWRDQKMSHAYVIINEQHELLPEQGKILRDQFDSCSLVRVPANGWTLEQQKEKVEELRGKNVVFVSPIPYMLKKLAFDSGYAAGSMNESPMTPVTDTRVWVLHNDKREKKELPDGRVIQTVAATGWRLV